jgi:hypothetical protein
MSGRFEVLMTILINISLLDVTPCSLVQINGRFGGLLIPNSSEKKNWHFELMYKPPSPHNLQGTWRQYILPTPKMEAVGPFKMSLKSYHSSWRYVL